MDFQLSSERLAAFIERVEVPARTGAGWAGPEARRILQYGAFAGSVIEQHQSLERTMVHARDHINRHEQQGRSVANGTLFTAATLTGSKGRFTRGWHAPAGGLWGCLVYISTLLPRYRLLAPLAVGVSCCEAVRASGAPDAVIRWINDVLINGFKVAGFLAENFTGPVSGEDYCLLGFGINVNNRDFPPELEQSATSLVLQAGQRVDLERFAYCFLAKLNWNLGLLYWQEQLELERFSDSGDEQDHPLIASWRELSDSIGRRVVFGFDVVTTPQYRATVRSINNDGGLRLLLEDGTEVVEYSGEIRYLD